MKHKLFAHLIVILLLNLQLLRAAPAYSNDIDYNDSNSAGGGGSYGAMGNLYRGQNNSQNAQTDYNTLLAHVKDFFMYLPVMMATVRESMSGFPKFAEGIRILTAKSGRPDVGDCNCEKNSNEIDSRQFG